MPVKIRIYNDKDKEKIKKMIDGILKEIFRKEPKGLDDLENIKENYLAFYVAEAGGDIIGTCAVKKEKNAAILKRMYVKKLYRKKGVGVELLDKAIKFCTKRRFKSLILTTSPQMKDAIKFYESNGFIKAKNIGEKILFVKKL